ncbi:hypothetical protein HHI36_013687 [Cryptolaemus montrouzieri]|uniref:Invertebrate defensins family profile domain-containing protein n=1 Tax=Cryptolaemus montrouzieri TaxID=559131 RepID=A0ABD2NIU2_9CUCU
MKFIVIAIFAVLVVMNIHASLAQAEDRILSRVRRVTCDILGSEAACALHCITLGYSGGFCNSQSVCECR